MELCVPCSRSLTLCDRMRSNGGAYFGALFGISVDEIEDKMADELEAKIKLGSKLLDEYSADCDSLVSKFEHEVVEHEKEIKIRDQHLKDVKEVMSKLKESFVEGEEKAGSMGDDGFAEEMFEVYLHMKLSLMNRL